MGMSLRCYDILHIIQRNITTSFLDGFEKQIYLLYYGGKDIIYSIDFRVRLTQKLIITLKF